MDHYFNKQFAQQLRSFFDAAPDDITTAAGYMSNDEQNNLYKELKTKNSGALEALGPRDKSPFKQGRAAILQYPSTAAQDWAVRNGPRHGIYIDKANPWLARPLGDRQKNKTTGLDAQDLLEIAMGQMGQQPDKGGGKLPTQTSPEKQRPQQPPQHPSSKEFSSLDEAAQARIQQSEGYRNTVYLDTTGNATVGYGHKVLPGDNLSVGDTVTDEQASAFFETDYAEHAAGASALSNWDELSDNLRSGLIDFAFNIGRNVFGNETGTAAWPTMMAALEAGDFDAAADEVIKDWGNVGEGRRNALVDLLMKEGS